MNDQLLDRIRKCLKLAESPNEHEAALAAEKAQELCRKYNIDLATISMDEGTSFAVGEGRIDGKMMPWKRQLINSVAKSMGGRAIYCHTHMEIYAPGESAQAIVELFKYLESQLTTISAIETANRTETYVHGKRWRSSFLTGAVSRLYDRLKERESVETIEKDDSMALVVLKSAVDDAVNAKYPKLSKTSSRKSVNPNAYAAGFRRANDVSFGEGALGRGRGQLHA